MESKSDAVLLAETVKDLQCLMSVFGKVLVCSKDGRRVGVNFSLNREILEEVDTFKYLGSVVSRNGGVVDDVNARINEGAKVGGALKSVWKVRSVSMGVKRKMYNSIVIPTVMYGAECWAVKAAESRRMDVFEMNCLRSMCGVTRLDRERNEDVRRRVGVEVELSERVNRSVLGWFGHVERMGEERMAKRVYNSTVNGVRQRGRPFKAWMDVVNGALGRRGLTLERARTIADNRNGWKDVVNG